MYFLNIQAINYYILSITESSGNSSCVYFPQRNAYARKEKCSVLFAADVRTPYKNLCEAFEVQYYDMYLLKGIKQNICFRVHKI